MSLVRIEAADALARLDSFDALIDARSESEHALDRLPGSVNWPTLDDAQRAAVGTEYTQVSPFTARKRGAVLAARNIAAHIERGAMDKPKDWTPLVYCWRGGQRSGSLALVLDQIGFRVHVLQGGYQAYRRAVIAALETAPLQFHYRVVCGVTGSGKSRLLQRLEAGGAQVLDLERLANHRGSVLGLVPGSPQPGQKQFESRVWDALRRFDPTRPVYVESESKKVGDLRVPEVLIERMRGSPCIQLELSIEHRVELLLADYHFFVEDVAAFCDRLDALRTVRGNETVVRWQDAARAGALPQVVRELLELHYDPIYRASMARNFTGLAQPRLAVGWDGTADTLDAVAAQVMALG